MTPVCSNHPEVPAAAACASCQHPFCASCLVPLQGFQVCGRCREYRLAQLQVAPPPGLLQDAKPTVADQIIPAKNPPALIAYYCGVFSLIPLLGNLLGPAAIVLGVMGLRARKRNPNLPGKAHAIVGIVLGTITTLVYWGLVIAGVIAAMTAR